MASKSKKRTDPKKTKKTNKANKPGENFVIDEIIIWITLAVSILLLLSNFGFGGSVGDAVSSFLMEVFGAAAYLVPFLLFGGVSFSLSNKQNRIAHIKTAGTIVLFVLLCSLFEMISKAGGSLGETLAGMMTPAFGVIGTYVVLIILMIICMVIITGKSVLKGVRTQSDRAYEKAKEGSARRKEAARERQELRIKEQKEAPKEMKSSKTKRKDRRVKGVSFDTTLTKKSPEIRELKPEEEPAAKQPDFVINRAAVPEPELTEELPDPFAEAEIQQLQSEKPVQTKKSRTRAGAEELAKETADIEQAAAKGNERPKKPYRFPAMSLLKRGKKGNGDSDAHLRETAMKLQDTLHSFGVNVTVTNVSCGPSVTRYELQPEQGVKVSKIVGLADDIKLNLAAADIRIEAPIPGKAAVGIEVPNKENSTVMLRDLLETKDFRESKSKISFAAGRDIAGQVVVADIAKMPHLLVAGATGSGKSVCINTLIMSILYKATPEEVKLIMIDPKVVELSVYNGIPHLMIPVVTDPKKAAGALNWAVTEMMRRYGLFAGYQVRDMKGYNEKVDRMEPDESGSLPSKLPQIVIIVDELADLMMVAPGEVEDAICRLAQLARAAGIHLVIATQRPSVNVITGLIKANMPSRIAFSVSSGVDSRTIIDMNGAEKLLGKGDMLFYPSGYQKPARVQGAFVSDKEVQNVVDFLKETNGDADYSQEVEEHMNSSAAGTAMAGSDGTAGSDRDTYFVDAGRFIIEKEKASIGMLQRVFKIGFNRAARIMDQLCEAGVVGPEEGTKPRKVLMSMEEFEQYIDEYI
ncbi:MAG: DNA translocase FtsK [Eubacteriales bacterium]|nr:DNA translocase FtsK [Eubacteriales bacterium]